MAFFLDFKMIVSTISTPFYIDVLTVKTVLKDYLLIRMLNVDFFIFAFHQSLINNLRLKNKHNINSCHIKQFFSH